MASSSGAHGHCTITPSSNRFLQKKWDDLRLQAHKDRLHSIKSSVDNGAPKNFAHIKQNLRKQKLDEDRAQTIHRHNNELLTRMHQIMTTTGSVDHRNLDWKPKKSLNYVKRAIDMQRINRENQTILRRIRTVQPQYSINNMETDFRSHKERTRSLSLFPPITTSKGPVKVSPPRRVAIEPRRVTLPPIVGATKSSRPDTNMSEIKEEIEVEVDDKHK